jgi:signal transduction histidine kinase
MGVRYLALLGFACAFWFNTSQVQRLRRRRLGIALFFLQLTVPLLGLPLDLTYLSAAEMPFLFRRTWSFIWLGVLCIVPLGVAAAALAMGDFEIADTLSHIPRVPAIALTIAMILAWILFAYSAGAMIVELEESRAATAWAKAQLEGSQGLLADISSMGERLRISRELHDTMGHHLTGLAVNLELASALSIEASAEAIQRAQFITRMVLAETREVVGAMRDDHPLDLKGALEKLVCRGRLSKARNSPSR